MKKAIIICILSLSLCLCHAAQPLVPPTEAAANKVENGTVPIKHDEPQNASQDKTAATVPEHKDVTPTVQPEKADDKNNSEKKSTDSKPEENSTKIADNKTAKADASSTEKVTEKAVPSSTTTLEPSTTHAETKTSTTTTTTTVAPTPHPKDNITEKPTVLAARGFDGPSFIGGIILTLGLLAIGFMGFKYYKNQTERNYHTL